MSLLSTLKKSVDHGPRRIILKEGLSYRVAEHMDEIKQAWALLHKIYCDSNYIIPNKWGLHTVRQAIDPLTVVVLAKRGDTPVATVSGIIDHGQGLPIEDAYPDEIQKLRKEGRILIEIGLHGNISQVPSSIFDLLRFPYWHGKHQGVTDYVCGIPPKNASIYERLFGFKIIGDEKSYATVNNNPVVLMHASLAETIAQIKHVRASRYFENNPLSQDMFERSYRFDNLEESELYLYLADKYGHANFYLKAA